MRFFMIVAAFLAVTPANAGFLDDLFGNTATQQVNYGGHKRSKHLNTHSTGAHNASWYNDRSGRTASGMRATYGVAHKTLPFGTRVRLTNLSNGRTIVAVVTDRGPFVRGRSLDVNRNAASALGFISNGTAHLHMEVAE